MPLHPTWPDIVFRLLLTVVAGALLGFNRSARGHAAGLSLIAARSFSRRAALGSSQPFLL